ncbi:MAG: hypothetical protein E7103_05320 [Prevotella sp.]|nr:hypothetical protein [Prevotella sp.]
MTDKEKIKAEVSTLIGEALLEHAQYATSPNILYDLKKEYSEKIVALVDSMQEEPVSEDLEKEFSRFLDEKEGMPRMRRSEEQLEWALDIARHFAEWQKRNGSMVKVKEVDLYNNGWIDCCERMPVETKQESNTLQGHREWTESEPVLAWDSSYGARIDSTRNGKWRSEQIGGCTGQMIHGIIAWRPIPEFSEELLLKVQIKAQKGE